MSEVNMEVRTSSLQVTSLRLFPFPYIFVPSSSCLPFSHFLSAPSRTYLIRDVLPRRLLHILQHVLGEGLCEHQEGVQVTTVLGRGGPWAGPPGLADVQAVELLLVPLHAPEVAGEAPLLDELPVGDLVAGVGDEALRGSGRRLTTIVHQELAH